MSYIALSVLAETAGVSRQALEKALHRIAYRLTTTWRGAPLVVRQVHGRGGRGGVQYQVRIDSLPLDLQERLKERLAPPLPLSREPDHRAAERNWYLTIIGPALPYPPRSAERRAAIDAILTRPLTD